LGLCTPSLSADCLICMPSNDLILSLLDKYTANTITSAEQDQLFSLIASGQYDQLLSEHFTGNFDHQSTVGPEARPEDMERLMRRILGARPVDRAVITGRFPRVRKYRWAIAACIGGFIAVGSYLMAGKIIDHSDGQASKHFAKALHEQANHTTSPMTVSMEDGSRVILHPGSALHMPDHFLQDKREVYLQGEAFFEISKDPNRGFFVYYNNLVTHVLGTSFSIKKDNKKKLVEVSVVSGKVQVYENRELLKAESDKPGNGVILMPNQKVIYQEEERQFSTTLVSNPVPVARDSIHLMKEGDFIFEDSPLLKVFRSLETHYGIEIVPENENIYGCLFTGDLTKQSLYDKLDIICQSVKLSYEINGTRILIKGKGCN
jgi:transmembrane sensor